MMKNKNAKTKRLVIALAAFLIILPVIASAYQLLEPLPGLTNQDVTGEKGLSNYLTWLFRFALAAAAFLAVLMIVIGGMQIIVGGASETQQKEGRNRIEMALWGLLLAISSVLILTTINPDLISTGFKIDPITIESKKGGGEIKCTSSISGGGQCKSSCSSGEDTLSYACSNKEEVCCVSKANQSQCGTVSGIQTFCRSQEAGCLSGEEKYSATCPSQQTCCKIIQNNSTCGLNDRGTCFKCSGFGCALTRCPDPYSRYDENGNECSSGNLCCVVESTLK